MSDSVCLHNRIVSIDVLRGFALLGILIMNIQSFGLLAEFYFNPLLLVGDKLPSMIDLVSHGVTYIFADQKFMTIFSLLFGSGLAIQLDSISTKGRPYLLCRNIVLLIMGMVHAYLLWPGDILVTYAICGFFAIAMINLNNRNLLLCSLLLFSVPMAISIINTLLLPYYGIDDLNHLEQIWQPSNLDIKQQISAMTGSWWQGVIYRAPMAVEMQLVIFPFETGWRVLSLMLFGVFLYRCGFYQGWPYKKYCRVIVFSGLIGFLLMIVGLYQNYSHLWSVEYSMFIGANFIYLGSALLALFYSSTVMLVCHKGVFLKSQRMLSNVGRMALSNYFYQTIVCTCIFYGFGFGLFSSVSRSELWVFLPPIWASQVVISSLCLKYFNRGPVEWLWRKLTQRVMAII